MNVPLVMVSMPVLPLTLPIVERVPTVAVVKVLLVMSSSPLALLPTLKAPMLVTTEPKTARFAPARLMRAVSAEPGSKPPVQLPEVFQLLLAAPLLQSMFAARTEKFQTPSTNSQRNIKLQTPKRRAASGAWWWEFLGSLDAGAWSFSMLPPGFAVMQFTIEGFHQIIITPRHIGVLCGAGAVGADLAVAQNSGPGIIVVQIFVRAQILQERFLGLRSEEHTSELQSLRH